MKLNRNNPVIRYAFPFGFGYGQRTTSLCEVFWHSVFTTFLLVALGLIVSLVIAEAIVDLWGLLNGIGFFLLVFGGLGLLIGSVFLTTLATDKLKGYQREIRYAEAEDREPEVPLVARVLLSVKQKTCPIIEIE